MPVDVEGRPRLILDAMVLAAEEAATLLGGLAAAASIVIGDLGLTFPPLTDDEDDDYLADAALKTGAFLVTRDDHANSRKVQGLKSGRPGTALRRIGAFGNDQPA